MKITQKIIIIGIGAMAIFIAVGWQIWSNIFSKGNLQPIVPVNERNDNFSVTIFNQSLYTLAPGVLVIHDENFSINFLNKKAPSIFEKLVEVGAPKEVISYLEQQKGVVKVIMSDFSNPNNTQRFDIGTGAETLKVSFMSMIIETNDTVVLLDASPLYETQRPNVHSIWLQTFDMGFEENTNLGSGFGGGQLDISRGDANINNGVSTDELVKKSSQFDTPIVLYTQRVSN